MFSSNSCISKQPALRKPNRKENLELASQTRDTMLQGCLKPSPHFWILKSNYKLLRFPVKSQQPLSRYSVVWQCYPFSWSSPFSLAFSHLMCVIWTIITTCALNFNYIRPNPSSWVHVSFEAIKLSWEFCRHVDLKFSSSHLFIIRFCSQHTILH